MTDPANPPPSEQKPPIVLPDTPGGKNGKKDKGKGIATDSKNKEVSAATGIAIADLDRLDRLLDTIRDERRSVLVKNISYEIGRPRLRPVAEMTPDLTNPYSMLSLEHLIALQPEATSNNMATSEHIALIFSDIEGLGVPTEHVTRVIINMVLYYANTSSSRYLDPNGSISFASGAIPRDSVHAVFNKRSTARKVARLYAPIAWNFMLLHNAPPADWQAMGFKYEERFAAFDFFDYVQNPAAIQPIEGLVRHPTPAEMIAHKTHMRIALDRQARDEHFGSYETEITGGLRGPLIDRKFRQAGKWGVID
ncbi:coat protein [Elderberry carlavirus E]|uniref:Capsid protein n=1 Tax=Elderberry carlavirus E TaxID=1569056 RepID=A0A0U4KJC8_9VIRU|nr:coat protein [Elderberry carlavirus E]ALY33533.1 coat protein [Elderberry carlavirus E]